MAAHTKSQLRALELFQMLEELPQGGWFARASAVAGIMALEGDPVEAGLLRRLEIPGLTDGDALKDIEVLEIDRCFVDQAGIHEDWDQVAHAYGPLDPKWQDDPTAFSPYDPLWLGKRGAPILEDAIAALASHLSQRDLSRNTTTSQARTACPAPRL